MRNFIGLATVLGASVLTSCMTAQPTIEGETYGPKEGESEANISVQFTSNSPENGDSTEFLSIFGGGGYHLGNNNEVGGQVFLAGNDDVTTLGLAPYYRKNFPLDERSLWYLGGQLNFVQIDTDFDSTSGFGYGVHGGYKTWLDPRTALFVEPRFTINDNDGQESDDFITLVGISYVF